MTIGYNSLETLLLKRKLNYFGIYFAYSCLLKETANKTFKDLSKVHSKLNNKTSNLLVFSNKQTLFVYSVKDNLEENVFSFMEVRHQNSIISLKFD